MRRFVKRNADRSIAASADHAPYNGRARSIAGRDFDTEECVFRRVQWRWQHRTMIASLIEPSKGDGRTLLTFSPASSSGIQTAPRTASYLSANSELISNSLCMPTTMLAGSRP